MIGVKSFNEYEAEIIYVTTVNIYEHSLATEDYTFYTDFRCTFVMLS